MNIKRLLIENVESYGQFASLPGNNFPPTEERAGPDGAEEEPPRVIASTTSAPIPTNNMGSMQDVDEDDAEDEDEGEEQCKLEITIYIYYGFVMITL